MAFAAGLDSPSSSAHSIRLNSRAAIGLSGASVAERPLAGKQLKEEKRLNDDPNKRGGGAGASRL